MTKQFKLLVIVALLFHGVGLFLLPELPFLFSADTMELMKYGGHGARVNPTHPIFYALYLLPFPALIALYFFQNWGRYLFLAFICIVLVGTFVLGASVSGPPETFVSLSATLLDGAILGLVFISPLKENFVTSSRG
jgi:hypothetical protein